MLLARTIGSSCVVVDRTKPNQHAGSKTDKEIFEELECGDCWHDADCIAVFMYLYNMETTCIPCTWQACMLAFKDELQSMVSVPTHLFDEYNASRRGVLLGCLLLRCCVVCFIGHGCS